MPYGIANTSGKPDAVIARAIIAVAFAEGITHFDTAQGYGDSEVLLGDSLAACCSSTTPCIITKLSPRLSEADDVDHMLVTAFERLRTPSLYAVLLHREEHLPFLDTGPGVALARSKERGTIRHIGVSVYSPVCALQALKHPLVSIVQVPASICDRRFESAGVFALAADTGKEIHVRSVFLQGALALQSDMLSGKLKGLSDWLRFYHEFCSCHSLPPLAVALHWALRCYPQAKVLFGAETPSQVRANCGFLAHDMPGDCGFWEVLDNSPPPQLDNLLNPSLWKT
jgi:aryl-alcohol dehydrogenase-like predicted oxidoreductase